MQATLVRWFDVEAMDAKAPVPGVHRLIRWYDMDGQISEASAARVRAMVRRLMTQERDLDSDMWRHPYKVRLYALEQGLSADEARRVQDLFWN